MGHWEIDTVMGAEDKHCILTMVERRSGFTLIGKLANRTQEQTSQRACWLIGNHPGSFRTITSDHGTYSHSYRKIVETNRCPFLLCSSFITHGSGALMKTPTA